MGLSRQIYNMLFLVAYDISNKRRLRKVAKLMESYGERVQRSVFECRLTPNKLAALVYQTKDLIKPRRDRVHIYHLCASCPSLEHGLSPLQLDDKPEIFIY
jgi:CRISPR-associated protein Cas2